MVNIADLVETLTRVGEEAVRLENGFDLQMRLNRGELSGQQFVDKYSALWKPLGILIELGGEESAKKIEAIKNGPEAEQAYKSVSDPAVLAVRLLGHDDVYAPAIVSDRAGGIEFGFERKDDDFVNRCLHDRLLFPSYEVTRIYLTVVPYLATGNRAFLVANHSKNFPSALEVTGFPLAKIVYNLEGIESVLSDEHIAIYQLLKNAGRHITEAKIDEPVRVGINEYCEKGMRVLTVTDSGLGISPEVIPELFTTYSSRPHGSGLGLRIVKRIAELREGYVKVTSTQQGAPTFAYDTNTSSLVSAEPAQRGTTFEVHMESLHL